MLTIPNEAGFAVVADKLGLSINGIIEEAPQDNVVTASSSSRDVILKSPRGSDNIYGEACALGLLASRGLAPKSELHGEVLVVDRVRPGTMMSTVWATSPAPGATITDHLRSAGEIVVAISQIRGDGLNLDVEDLLRRDVSRALGSNGEVTSSILSPEVLAATLQRLSELTPLRGAPSLCHGDFYANNLLWDNNAWIVIDPRAVVGDPCADVGRMATCVALGYGWSIEAAVEVLCEVSNLSPERSVVWARAWLLQTLGHHWHNVEQSGPGINRYIELLTS